MVCCVQCRAVQGSHRGVRILERNKMFPCGGGGIFGHSSLVRSIPDRTAQGGGGSFKDRKPLGQIGCSDAWIAEQIH